MSSPRRSAGFSSVCSICQIFEARSNFFLLRLLLFLLHHHRAGGAQLCTEPTAGSKHLQLLNIKQREGVNQKAQSLSFTIGLSGRHIEWIRQLTANQRRPISTWSPSSRPTDLLQLICSAVSKSTARHSTVEWRCSPVLDRAFVAE